MINGRLKTLENLTELLYSELKACADDPAVTEQTFALLKAAAIVTIDLKRKIELARGWNTLGAAK